MGIQSDYCVTGELGTIKVMIAIACRLCSVMAYFRQQRQVSA